MYGRARPHIHIDIRQCTRTYPSCPGQLVRCRSDRAACACRCLSRESHPLWSLARSSRQPTPCGCQRVLGRASRCCRSCGTQPDPCRWRLPALTLRGTTALGTPIHSTIPTPRMLTPLSTYFRSRGRSHQPGYPPSARPKKRPVTGETNSCTYHSSCGRAAPA
eukprot:COSAG02_NODE_1252_length_13595_cov_2.754148_7_plen_163_part_00